jgi:hypothetical protein
MKRYKVPAVFTIIYQQPYDIGTNRMATAHAKTERAALDMWRKEWPCAILVNIKQGYHGLDAMLKGVQ